MAAKTKLWTVRYPADEGWTAGERLAKLARQHGVTLRKYLDILATDAEARNRAQQRPLLVGLDQNLATTSHDNDARNDRLDALAKELADLAPRVSEVEARVASLETSQIEQDVDHQLVTLRTEVGELRDYYGALMRDLHARVEEKRRETADTQTGMDDLRRQLVELAQSVNVLKATVPTPPAPTVSPNGGNGENDGQVDDEPDGDAPTTPEPTTLSLAEIVRAEYSTIEADIARGRQYADIVAKLAQKYDQPIKPNSFRQTLGRERQRRTAKS